MLGEIDSLVFNIRFFSGIDDSMRLLLVLFVVAPINKLEVDEEGVTAENGVSGAPEGIGGV